MINIKAPDLARMIRIRHCVQARAIKNSVAQCFNAWGRNFISA
jgi:hypothetical protein